MPENVGGIEYTVSADVSGLRSAERVVDRSAGNMAESLDRADNAASRFDGQMRRIPASVRNANRDLKQVNGTVGQLGFQLQDVAVQLQSGTSPFVVLGQQGSQVASLFGPGGAVLGAIIAVGSALAGVFASGAMDASDAVDELSIDVDELIDRIGELTEAQQAYLQATLSGRIAELQDQIVVLRNEAESLSATLSAPIQDDQFLKNTSDRLLEVNAQIDTLAGQVDNYRDAIQGARDNNEDWNRSNDGASRRLQSLIASTQASAAAIEGESGALVKSNRAKAIYIAQSLGATQAQLNEINAAFDRIEAYDQEQEAIRRVAQEKRRQLIEQRDLERQLAEERLAETGEAFGVDESTAQRLIDLQDQAENTAQAINSAFANSLLNIGDNFASTFSAAIVQGESLRDSLRNVAQAFLQDILGSLIQVGARILINQALGQAAQTALTATAAASGAAIASAFAPAAALVSLATAGGNAAPAISGILATQAVASTTAAIPGLQTGGPIGSGQVRRVNEQGPEMFTDGARTYLMAPRGGQVINARDTAGALGGGSPNVNITVHNNMPDRAGFRVGTVEQSESEIAINLVIADLESGSGPISRTLANTTNTVFNANR